MVLPNTTSSPIEHLGIDRYLHSLVDPTIRRGIALMPGREQILAAAGVSFGPIREQDRSYHLGFLSEDSEARAAAVEQGLDDEATSTLQPIALPEGKWDIATTALDKATASLRPTVSDLFGGVVIYKSPETGEIETGTFVHTDFFNAAKKVTQQMVLGPRGQFRKIGPEGLAERERANQIDRAVRVNDPATLNRSIGEIITSVALRNMPKIPLLRQEFQSLLPRPEMQQAEEQASRVLPWIATPSKVPLPGVILHP